MNTGSFLNKWNREIFNGLLGGLLLAFSFPPYPTRLLSLIALVPLIRYFIVTAGERRKGYLWRAFVLGFVFGLGFFMMLLFWVSNLIPASSARMPWLMIPALILLVLYLSCYTGLFSLVQAYLVRRFGVAALFAAPALWSLAELARSRGELGFSWGIISNALAVYPLAIQGVSIYGPFGLSFILVLVNVLLAFTILGGSKGRRLVSFVCVVVLAGAHLVLGAREISRFDMEAEERGGKSRVTVVQPNIDLAIKWNPAFRDSIFNKIERMTINGTSLGTDLVIFPETSAPIAVSHAPRHVRWLKRIARESGVDLFIGYIDHSFENDAWRSYNAAGLFDSEGRHMAQYNKVNLLPFGERIPFSQYIPALSKLNFGQANFKAGEVQTVFKSKAGKFGALICFESTFSDYTRRYVLKGAEFLVNITNDGWFGSSRGPKQHAETAILRAVENRVTLVRAANTGISMVVDPVGRSDMRIGLDEEGILQAPIHAPSGLTFYTRYGHLAFFIMVMADLAAVAVIAVLSRRG